MKITLFAAGSQGDLLPCLRLAKQLQLVGMHPLMAAPHNFAGQVDRQGLPFHRLRGDVQQIMAGETGREFMEKGGGNPIRSIIAMRKMLGPIAIEMAEDLLEASRNADALITLAVFAPLGETVAEICGIPLLLVEPTPVLPTGDFPAPGWPVQKSLGRALNRLSGHGMLQVIWQWYRPFVNEFRKRFGLRLLRSADFHRILTSVPLLGAYSPTVIPYPPDWPQNVHISGYWFGDADAAWQPSAELDAFLAAGKPPVYVGFGSMAGRRPEHFARIVLKALAESGERGLIATGWGGMSVLNVPKNVFVLDAAPHGWLFPRMTAVVHHGGAGTTAEGLRAGVPTVVIPFIVDQLFWGKRVQALGVAPEPIRAKNLSADKLGSAILAAVTDQKMKRQAEVLGQTIRAEKGLDQAVSIIREYLGAGT